MAKSKKPLCHFCGKRRVRAFRVAVGLPEAFCSTACAVRSAHENVAVGDAVWCEKCQMWLDSCEHMEEF